MKEKKQVTQHKKVFECPIHKIELYTFEHHNEEGFCNLCGKWHETVKP